MNGFLGAQTFISAIVRVGKPNKALHLTTRASAIYESCFAIWGLAVVRRLLVYRSGGR